MLGPICARREASMGGAVSQTSTGDDAEFARASTPLADVVRQRLVQVASDVLSGLPADQVPAPLRPIAKFAPAKRPQLGAAALSAALDADEEFRERVATTVSDALPQLVEAVRAGNPTPASDPIDTAVVAYRSEEHTSELQSHVNLVCRLLLE